jgi:ketosteroid isomerase-like protein
MTHERDAALDLVDRFFDADARRHTDAPLALLADDGVVMGEGAGRIAAPRRSVRSGKVATCSVGTYRFLKVPRTDS